MIVYVFKFSSDVAESGQTNDLTYFLQSLVKQNGEVFNYHPSKERVIVGVHESIYNKIREWLLTNVSYPFEFEEHGDGQRSL